MLDDLIEYFRRNSKDRLIKILEDRICYLESGDSKIRERLHNVEVQLANIDGMRKSAEIIRDKSPAVRDAWEQYQIMLKLHL